MGLNTKTHLFIRKEKHMGIKSQIIGVRVTPEQKSKIEIVASQNAISPAELLRINTLEKLSDIEIDELSEYEPIKNSVNINLTLTKEQAEKIDKMSNELGATRQQCIRRLINEGKIYDLRIRIDMEEEFLSLASELRTMNKTLERIYSVCKRVDGVLTKHEVEHLYDVIHQIDNNTGKIRVSLFKTQCILIEQSLKRMDILIKEAKKDQPIPAEQKIIQI